MKRDLLTLASQWPSSVLTQKDFCKRDVLNYNIFQYWIR